MEQLDSEWEQVSLTTDSTWCKLEQCYRPKKHEAENESEQIPSEAHPVTDDETNETAVETGTMQISPNHTATILPIKTDLKATLPLGVIALNSL